jgi:hypothetical protein
VVLISKLKESFSFLYFPTKSLPNLDLFVDAIMTRWKGGIVSQHNNVDKTFVCIAKICWWVLLSHPCGLVQITLVFENNLTTVKVHHSLSNPTLGSFAANFRGSGRGMNTYSY